MKLASLADGRIVAVEAGAVRPLRGQDGAGMLGAIQRHGCNFGALAADVGHEVLPLDGLIFGAPLPRPGRIIGIGRNYGAHAAEGGLAVGERPRVFFKPSASVSGPGAMVVRPADVVKLDFEGELVVVVGNPIHDASPDEAARAIFGYTVGNDLSAREFQFDIDPAQTSLAKGMDGFAAIGPVIVTADELGSAPNLRLRTHVNGEKLQDALTGDLIFPIATCLSYMSRYMRLEPGDLLFSGTPAGVGVFRDPPRFLQPGDLVEVEIDGIGKLDTRIG